MVCSSGDFFVDVLSVSDGNDGNGYYLMPDCVDNAVRPHTQGEHSFAITMHMFTGIRFFFQMVDRSLDAVPVSLWQLQQFFVRLFGGDDAIHAHR